MRTYNELKQIRIEQETEKINSEINSLKHDNPSEYERNKLKNNIKIRKKVLENIDEVVKSEIAYHINLLYEGLNLYSKDPNFEKLFFDDFELFIFIIANISITEDNKFKANSYYGYNLDIQRAILYFDFTLDELNILIKEKFNQDTRDKMIIFINNQYETNIPLTKEIETCKQRLFECWFNDRERIIKNKEYKLLQVRNGEFMKGDIYPLYYHSSIEEHYDSLLISLENNEEQKNIIKTRKKKAKK